MRKAYLIISACPEVFVEPLALKGEIAADPAGIETAFLQAKSVVYLTDTHKKAQRRAAIRTLRANGFGYVVGLYLSPDTHLLEHSTAQETQTKQLLQKPPCYEEGYDELYVVTESYQLTPHD
jgi:hypothetical protein